MLAQADADQFMQMPKHFVRPPATITIPPGADDTYELADANDREKFSLDVWRGTLRLTKLKFQFCSYCRIESPPSVQGFIT
jgi:hypothetical protein